MKNGKIDDVGVKFGATKSRTVFTKRAGAKARRESGGPPRQRSWRGWRRLVIDDVAYRWRRIAGEYRETGYGELTIVMMAVREDAPVSRLRLRSSGLAKDISPWGGLDHLFFIGPKQVRVGLEQALAAGWNPTTPGDFAVDVKPGLLIGPTKFDSELSTLCN